VRIGLWTACHGSNSNPGQCTTNGKRSNAMVGAGYSVLTMLRPKFQQQAVIAGSLEPVSIGLCGRTQAARLPSPTAASMSPGETRRKPKRTMPRDSPAPGACSSRVITFWQPGIFAVLYRPAVIYGGAAEAADNYETSPNNPANRPGESARLSGISSALETMDSTMRNLSQMKSHSFRIPKEQTDCFRKRGYVFLPSFFPADLACGLREISDKMSSQAFSILESSRAAGVSLSKRAKASPMELIVVPEESSPTQVCRYEFMIGSDSTFREFVRDCLEGAVSELVGESVLPFKDKTNEKLPGGGAFRPHQDLSAYRAFKPRYHATALLTIDPANIANGCVQFATNFDEFNTANSAFVLDRIEGKALLHYNDGGPHHGDIRADIAAELRWQPLQTSPVDLVVFDSFVPHFSGPNKSKKPRRAIFVTFNRASEGSLYDEYYADKRLNYDDPKFHVSTPTSHRDIQEFRSACSLDRPDAK